MTILIMDTTARDGFTGDSPNQSRRLRTQQILRRPTALRSVILSYIISWRISYFGLREICPRNSSFLFLIITINSVSFPILSTCSFLIRSVQEIFKIHIISLLLLLLFLRSTLFLHYQGIYNVEPVRLPLYVQLICVVVLFVNITLFVFWCL